MRPTTRNATTANVEPIPPSNRTGLSIPNVPVGTFIYTFFSLLLLLWNCECERADLGVARSARERERARLTNWMYEEVYVRDVMCVCAREHAVMRVFAYVWTSCYRWLGLVWLCVCVLGVHAVTVWSGCVSMMYWTRAPWPLLHWEHGMIAAQ